MKRIEMIQKERVKVLNRKEIQKGKYILYWMQASQRDEYNHALEFAILKANELRQPLIVFFGITDQFPEANERHYYLYVGRAEGGEAFPQKEGDSNGHPP